jgi:hypothetical protein
MSRPQRYIVIPHWMDYQHKDIWRKSRGAPPWIKTYTSLLHDDDYLRLPGRLRGLLHGIWLLYAASGGVVPASPSYISRMLGLETEWGSRSRRHGESVARAWRERGESVASSWREFGEDSVRSRDLKALEKAGFIAFESRPIRYSVAPREEKRREELPTHPPTSTVDAAGRVAERSNGRHESDLTRIDPVETLRVLREAMGA